METDGVSADAAQSSAPSTMKAWRVHQFGPPEVMIFGVVARPTPGPGEVLVKVRAAGVGPWDAWIRAGKSALPQPLPLTLGSELSGTIEDLGSAVSGMTVGEEVFGVTNSRFVGAYAEYAVVSAGMIAKKPKLLTHPEAASVPVVAITACQALFDYARLEAGQAVVIHGGAGNVGAYAVQLARRAGIRVIATVSTEDTDYVRSLGAESVIDFRTQRFEDEIKDVDAVLDLVGGDTQARSFQVLRPGGRLVSTVSKPDQDIARQRGVAATFFLVEVTIQRLDRIAGLIDRGELDTHVGIALPLKEARQAHMMLEGRSSRPKGKIILRVLPDRDADLGCHVRLGAHVDPRSEAQRGSGHQEYTVRSY
jgi:NADPH:quinone reductase-like Zn-dependent oxidoreductase